MCIPYPWFDLEQNRISQLTLVPAMAMDRSLQQYQKLTPAKALEKILGLAEKVKAVNGNFVVILHNETFSDSGEWKGWLEVIRKMKAQLNALQGHES